MPNNSSIQKIYDRFSNDVAGFATAMTNIFVESDGKTKQELYPKQILVMNGLKPEERIVAIIKTRQCKSADTFVYTENGPVSIKELEESKYRGKVWTLDENKESKLDQVVDVWYSGDKELYEVKLWTGEKIKLTQGDKVKTNQGWKSVEDLKVDDLVWIFNGNFGEIDISDEEAILMGYFITDGSFSNPTPKFTNINFDYIDEFENCVKKLFDVQTRRVPKGKGCDLMVVGNLHYGNKPSEYSQYLSNLGLRGLTHDKKVLPEKFLNLNKKSTAILLNRMFAGDGWYAGNRNKNSATKSSNEVGIGSPSLKFVHQVNYLLNKFGIHGRIEICKFKNTPNPFYKLRFSAFEYVQKFINEIGIYGKQLRFPINPEHNLKKQKNRIKSITKLDGLHPTYDLETRKYHSFIANAIHVHNCGITTAAKARVISEAYFGKVPNILIASASQLQASKVLREIKEHIRSMPEFMRPEFSKETETEIHFSSGSKIISLPSNPSTVRGFSGGIILDEYGILNRKDSEALWEALLPSIIKNNYRIILISTPRGKNNLFHDFCNPKKDENDNIIGVSADKVIKIHWSDVPHVKKAVEEMDLANKMPHRSFLQEFCCEFLSEEEDSLFSAELIDNKMFDKGMEFLNLSFIDTMEGSEISSDLALKDIKSLYDQIFIGFDPAITASKDGDGSIVVAFGIKNDEWSMIFLKRLPKGMEVGPQCDYVARLAQVLCVDKVGFDSTGGLGLAFQSRLKETPIINKLFPITFSQSLKTQEYTEIKNKIETHKMKSPVNEQLKTQMTNLGYNALTGRIAAMGSWRTNKDDIPSAILCAHACRVKKNNSGFSIIRVR